MVGRDQERPFSQYDFFLRMRHTRLQRCPRSGTHKHCEVCCFDPDSRDAGRQSPDWGFGARQRITEPLFGMGIFTQEGLAAKSSRKLIRLSLLPQRYDDLHSFERPVTNLIGRIRELSRSSDVEDLQPLFFILTLDMTTALLFGKSVQALGDDPDARVFTEAFDTAQDCIVQLRSSFLLDVGE
jgi:hypothetical protein